MKTLSPMSATCSCFHYNSHIQKSSLNTPASLHTQHKLSGLKAFMMLLVILVAGNGVAVANTYTATTNGLWTNPETWSGNSPGSLINAADSVLIPAGISVLLGADVQVNSSLASIIVNGALNGDAFLVMGSGMLSGTGTINNVAVNIQSKGTVSLQSPMVITGQLALQRGSLNLNDYNLTLQGNISCTGSGSLIATQNSGITITGAGAMGNLVFATNANRFSDLIMNTNTDGAISLGSDVFVSRKLGLYRGLINLGNHNVTITDPGQIYGGDAGSYLFTNPGDSGRLVMHINGKGGFGIFEVGTSDNYAPVRIDNNSPNGGNFSGYVQSGYFTDAGVYGPQGNAVGTVNTIWHLWSNVTAPGTVLVSIFWNNDMEDKSFNNGQVYISQYVNDAWDNSPTAIASMQINGLYMAQRSGFHTLGTLSVFSQTAGNTATTDVNADGGISVYPVPATTQVNLLLPKHEKYSRISVYDILGKQVYETLPEADLTTINVANLTPGEYFIRVDNAFTKRFIKN